MESTVLGTFYPLDIKGDMRGVLLQIEKSMLRHTHLKFHFRRTTFSKGKKKRQLLIKMTTEPEDLPSLSKGRAETRPRQRINRSLPWGHFLHTLPDKPARPGMAASRASGLASSSHPCADPRSCLPHGRTPITHHTWRETTWKTPEIVRPLPFPRGLYHLKAEASESSRSGVQVKRLLLQSEKGKVA